MKKIRMAIIQCKFLLSNNKNNLLLIRELERLKAELKERQRINKQKRIARIIAKYKDSVKIKMKE